jgi:hypothetical protein
VRVSRALPLVLLGALACGSPTRVPISLDLDDSCAASGGASTPCDANVGLWLVDGDSGLVLADACVDFSTGARPYAELPAVLSDEVEFPDVSAESIRLDLALYSPARTGCPTVGGGVIPTLYGQSEVVDPSAVERIVVPLQCLDRDLGSDGSLCETTCLAQQRSCTADLPGAGDRGACSEAYFECAGICDDDVDCVERCADDEDECIAKVEECEQGYDECLKSCGGPDACAPEP